MYVSLIPGGHITDRGEPHLRNADVVVIGAGIGGLAVAEALHSAGATVAVLEARSRIGGRLLTRGLDLGASWFWDGERRVRAFTDRFGIDTFSQYIQGDAIIDDPAGVQRYRGNPIDAPAYRFVHGAALLTDALARELPEGVVMLDHPVIEISDSLVVTTEKDTWHGHHVVIAVPPALAAEKIRLPRNLPTHLIDVARETPVWMGETVKVVAIFDEPFWRANGLAGAAISRVGPLHEIHDLSGPTGSPAALFGFARSGFDELNHSEIRNQFARIFGERAASSQELLIEDWGRQPWTNPQGDSGVGSPNYGMFGHEVYQHSYLDGRLHWCSTETAPHYAGHIEGALEAAERTLINISRLNS